MKPRSGGLILSSAVNTGSNLVVTGSGGVPGATYYVMASTNLSEVPSALWQRVATNAFSGNGMFTNTIPITLSVPQEFLIVASTLPSMIPGLVAAYSFDEGTGTTVKDSSGNANNGTIGSATWSPYGRYGSALMFDGATAFVTVYDSTSLHLTSGMTLEAWVNPVTVSLYPGGDFTDIIYKGQGEGTNGVFNDNFIWRNRRPYNYSAERWRHVWRATNTGDLRAPALCRRTNGRMWRRPITELLLRALCERRAGLQAWPQTGNIAGFPRRADNRR